MPKLPEKYKDITALVPGKNAKVFRAKHTYLNQDLFIKIYDIPDDDPMSALKEPHLLQEFDHPNVVRVRYVDEITGEPGHEDKTQILLAMDFADGGPLNDRIRDCITAGQPATIHRAIDTVLGIAGGIAHMHDKGVVHCDLKPANIVFHGATVKVTDLGLARRLGDTGRATGSKHAYIYRPPEVWQGHGYSVRSDVYQLGIILYELLGGVLDFAELSALSPGDLYNRCLSGSIIDLDSLGPHISSSLKDLVTTATGPEASRPVSARAFASELHNVRAKHPDLSYQLTSDGFEILGPSDGIRSKLMKGVKKSKQQWEITIVDVRTDGTTRVRKKATEVKHSQLSVSLEFRKFLELIS